jgi:cytochrome P450
MTMTEQGSSIPSVSTDLQSERFNRDPYPVLAELRRIGPVVFHEGLGRFLVLSFAGCTEVLGDVRRFDSSGLAGFFEDHFGGLTMEALDDRRHDQMRAVWAPDFQRGRLDRRRNLVVDVVRRFTVPFVERVRDGEVVDAMTTMTRGIPTLVMARMLGLEDDCWPQLAAWSEAMGRMSEGLRDPSSRGEALVRASHAATAELNAYLSGVLDERLSRPLAGDDLLSLMLRDDFGRSMSAQEVVASATQLVFAGTETTSKLMATTLVALAEYPDQAELVRADRALVPKVVEEVHRWRTLTQVIPRHACADDSSVQGVPIPRGAAVDVLTGAANRDPHRWEDPDRFDVRRGFRGHLGFGHGMHICLGLSLARLEMQVWLDLVLDMLSGYRIAAPLDYGQNFNIRAPKEVLIAA